MSSYQNKSFFIVPNFLFSHISQPFCNKDYCIWVAVTVRFYHSFPIDFSTISPSNAIHLKKKNQNNTTTPKKTHPNNYQTSYVYLF